MVTKTTDTTHYIELLEQKDEKDDRKCRKCRISDIFKYAPFPHQHPNKIRRPDAINM